MTDGEVMARFESLGANCEFGIAQRMAGIEPFGLFRFAASPINRTLELLRARFDGLGDPDQTSVWLRDNEWMIKADAYDWSMHTWTIRADVTGDAALAAGIKRLTYLRDRMVDLLDEASRTFVVLRPAEPVTRAEAEALHEALCDYGPNSLLYVTAGEEPPRVVRPGLIHGTIPKFAHPAIVDKDTDGTAWVRLCRSALRLLDRPIWSDAEFTAALHWHAQPAPAANAILCHAAP
jgi:hypothetical protein